MARPCILYGGPFSLYTGKARAYLIKQKIPYQELTPTTERYYKVVLPAVHRWRIPTIELPDSTFIQDGTMIIEYFENRPDISSTLPPTPKQKIVSLLFDVIGMEGLLRPAMHYRWNYPEYNDWFLKLSFATMSPPGQKDPIAVAEDLVPETKAAAECINQWLADNDPAADDPVERGVSFGEFDLRGTKITALAQPWRFFLLARMQKAFNELGDGPKEEVRALMQNLGLEPLLFLTIDREVKRHDNLEVWG